MGKPDVNLYNMNDYEELTDKTIDGEAFDDALKLSNKMFCNVKRVHVLGGREDAVDINRGKGHVFEDCTLVGRGNFCVTIKGGAKDITFKNCVFSGGKETTVDLGNWSDQSQDRTINISFIDCKTADGSPLKIRCMWANDPALVRTNAKVYRMPEWVLFFFKLAKKLGVM